MPGDGTPIPSHPNSGKQPPDLIRPQQEFLLAVKSNAAAPSEDGIGSTGSNSLFVCISNSVP